MDSKTAMRDSNGNVVFVDNDGRYVKQFPCSNIVRKSYSEDIKFRVYGFVGTDNDYEEKFKDFDEEYDAVNYATMIYGRNDVDMFRRDGEVFEVEVHEIYD